MASSHVLDLTAPSRERGFAEALDPDGRLLNRCIQCGTCTASCPAAASMDLTPRRMWRMTHLGLVDEVLRSKTVWLCSMCYQCQVRCPRGIPLTELITRLKQVALARGVAQSPDSRAFYNAFAQVMRRYGRVREFEFMVRYLLATGPVKALGFAGLGLDMLRHGKVRLEVPSIGGEGRLDKLFDRVAELEAQA